MKARRDLVFRRGEILRTADSAWWISLEAERCAQCTGACAIALGGGGRPLQVDCGVLTPMEPAPEPGTAVRLAVSRRHFTNAVVRTFGLPLGGLVTGAAVGGWLHGLEATTLAAVWMLAGMAVAGFGAAWFGHRNDRDEGLRLQVYCDRGT
jgi:hypothetical protein